MTALVGLKVLLLEDQALLIIEMETTLLDAGAAEVISFRTCEEAWKYLQQECPDVAIIDFYRSHPVCSAIAAFLIEQKIPFVIYSGTSFQSQFDDLQLGNQYWLSKPSDPEGLLLALEKVIGASDETKSARGGSGG